MHGIGDSGRDGVADDADVWGSCSLLFGAISAGVSTVCFLNLGDWNDDSRVSVDGVTVVCGGKADRVFWQAAVGESGAFSDLVLAAGVDRFQCIAVAS